MVGRGGPGGAAGGGKRVVISSLTGRPIPWEEREGEDHEQDGDAAHDAQIRRDVPPHWGSGR